MKNLTLNVLKSESLKRSRCLFALGRFKHARLLFTLPRKSYYRAYSWHSLSRNVLAKVP